MNILIQIRENSADNEIREFTEGNGDNIFITHTTEESIRELSIHNFEKAVISLKNLQDAAILKYMNDYYPDIKIVVIANKAFDDVISIFKTMKYSVIHEPLKLSELKHKLNKTIYSA